MKSGMSYTLAAATLFALAIPAQAEPPRTLVPVADPLDQLLVDAAEECMVDIKTALGKDCKITS